MTPRERVDGAMHRLPPGRVSKDVGFTPGSDLEPLTIRNALDEFVGSWSVDDARAVIDAVADLDTVQDQFWR